MPEVSVIIPSFNHDAYVAEAVRSVLEQTLADFELIVVDDGSTDKSLEILKNIDDPRLKVLAQENCGAHNAINRGLSSAKGHFLAILNSDDRYHPCRLEKLTRVLKENPQAGLAASYIHVIDAQGRHLGVKHGYYDLEPWPLEKKGLSFRAGNDLHADLLVENFLASSSNLIMRREIFEKVGGFRPLRYCHDWDFALRASQFQEVILAPEPLLDYRLHSSNTIHENQPAMIYEICWILAVHLPIAANEEWFTSGGEQMRSQQLLHSIYTYGMDRVLNLMLIAELDRDESKALQWLAGDHPARLECLSYIQDQLVHSSKLQRHTLRGVYQELKMKLRGIMSGS
jgi:glycosyltransferase involved in cell wall biosynthesis